MTALSCAASQPEIGHRRADLRLKRELKSPVTSSEQLRYDPSRKKAEQKGNHQYDDPGGLDFPEKKTHRHDLSVLDREHGEQEQQYDDADQFYSHAEPFFAPEASASSLAGSSLFLR